ncbi:MAG: hypothetical protein ACJ752_04660 [Gaiellaceae bacterium]
MITVVDPGPIPLSAIERYDDPDIEGSLEHDGADPATATFRLVEIDLEDLEDVRWLPGPKRWGTRFVEELQSAGTPPPLVIVATARADGTYGLLDGLNRTHAHGRWAAVDPRVRVARFPPGVVSLAWASVPE